MGVLCVKTRRVRREKCPTRYVHPLSYHPPNFAGGGGQEERARQSGSSLRPRAETRLPVQLRMSSLGSLCIPGWSFADNALPREAIRSMMHDVLSSSVLDGQHCFPLPAAVSHHPRTQLFPRFCNTWPPERASECGPRAKPLQISGGAEGLHGRRPLACSRGGQHHAVESARVLVRARQDDTQASPRPRAPLGERGRGRRENKYRIRNSGRSNAGRPPRHG